MGIYVDSTEIADTKDLTTDQVDSIILSCEAMVQYYCQDIFYEKEVEFKFSGDGSKYFFKQKRPYIVSISKIEHIDDDGTLDEVDATYYILSESFLITRVFGKWSNARPYNYKITGVIGRAETDDLYMPSAIKSAVLALVVSVIDEMFASGTNPNSGVLLSGKVKSESITNYSYTLKDLKSIDLQSSTPFGIPYVDNLLQPYKSRCLNVGAISSKSDTADSIYSLF